jgi:hypothetical protein
LQRNNSIRKIGQMTIYMGLLQKRWERLQPDDR